MSEPSPTGYAIANEVMTWDAFGELINLDTELHWPAAGHDMQGVEIGENGDKRTTIRPCFNLGPSGCSRARAGNDDHNYSWVLDGMPALPRCPSQQQPAHLQGSHHAVGLPPCLPGGRPDRAIAALDATHDYPSNHVDDAGEINTRNIAYMHSLNVTQSGIVISSPSMLSASDGIASELSSSANNAGTGPPSKAIHTRPCACITCVEIGYLSQPTADSFYEGLQWDSERNSFHCRYPGCQEKKYPSDIAEHERSHFRVEGQYPCKEEHCKFTTKRWSDLKRHSSSKHCTSLKKPFPCPVLWCKYSGDNGFARKDKLSSHFKTVHGGMSMPGKANQSIKPKVSGSV